jgi:hypothetical protein
MRFIGNPVSFRVSAKQGELLGTEFADTQLHLKYLPTDDGDLRREVFELAHIVSGDLTTELDPELWRLSNNGRFGKIGIATLHFIGSAFSARLHQRGELNHADAVLYRAFVHREHIDLAVPYANEHGQRRLAGLVLKLDYGLPV